MTLEFSTSHLSDSISLFRYYKKLAERALAQVADDQLFYAQDEECNSIAIIVEAPRRKHALSVDRFPDE